MTCSPAYLIALLGALVFTLATDLQVRLGSWGGNRRQNQSVLAVLLGDSRRMLANHFFVKADVYFHRGYYPSIFDTPKRGGQSHLEEDPAHHAPEEAEGEHEEDDFLGEPGNWIEKFGRHFFVSRHSHLEGSGEAREMLPWLQISADLDPYRIETYIMGAFWLRDHLGNVDEAERFLREGWRFNPDSYKILFELGRLYYQKRDDVIRGRNILELALRKWEEQAGQTADPDVFPGEQILAQLAILEENEKRWDQSIDYLTRLKKISPHPERIQGQIEIVEKEKSEGGKAEGKE